jgi:hypothetical protein
MADAHRQHYNVTFTILVLAGLSLSLLQPRVLPALRPIQLDLHTLLGHCLRLRTYRGERTDLRLSLKAEWRRPERPRSRRPSEDSSSRNRRKGHLVCAELRSYRRLNVDDGVAG